MKTRFILTAVLSTMYLMSFAQLDNLSGKTVKKASYGFGYSNTNLLDNFVSANTYESHNVPFHFRYSIEKGKTVFEYNFNGIIGFNFHSEDPGTVFPIQKVNQPEVSLDEITKLSSPLLFQQEAYVRYLTRVYHYREGKLNAYVGGEVREHFLMSFAEDPTFTFAELNLGLAVMLSYEFNDNHTIKTYMSGTLLGSRVNLPHANVYHIKNGGPDGVFSSASWAYRSPWDNSRSSFTLEYIRQLSEEWSIGCEFNSSGYHFTEEPEVNYNDHSMLLKLTRTL